MTYSVTQSYANSLLGYVVLDTFNNVSRDEDNILDRIYNKYAFSSKLLEFFTIKLRTHLLNIYLV